MWTVPRGLQRNRYRDTIRYRSWAKGVDVLKPVLGILLMLCFAVNVASAAQDPFIGDWNLDASQSKFPDEMTLQRKGANTYAIDFNGVIEAIVADGTFQTGQAGTLLSVKQEAPDTWIVERKKGARLLLRATWKLSKDNRTLTDYFRGIQKDGSPFNMDYVYQRTVGGSGFAAHWQSIKEAMLSPVLLHVKAFQGDGLSFVIPAENLTQHLQFDRVGHPCAGTVGQGDFSCARRINERAVVVTRMHNRKATTTEEIALSTDLQTLTMTLHPTASRPTVMVFKRK